MDEKEVFGSHLVVFKDRSNDISSYSMYFGVTCAFFATRFLSEPKKEDANGSKEYDIMLQRSVQLLGLLVWSVQREGGNWEKCVLQNKLENAEREIEELKKLRHEDGKANEKVVGIFASQEQNWFTERKKLRLHIEALMRELRAIEKKKDEKISELSEKMKEIENSVKSRDEMLGEVEKKRKELEDKLEKAENIERELRESLKKEGEDHVMEIRKHKTAFIELVSNHRQLEAETGRALRQVEVTRQELDSVLEQKEESVLLAQKLSMEIVKLHKDLDQKDKILAAMMRKSKSDLAEKQALLKEVKVSKTKKKQAELEVERWMAVKESKHERQSLRSMFRNQFSSRVEVSSGTKGMLLNTGKSRSKETEYVLECADLETKGELDVFSPLPDYYSAEGYEKLDGKRFEGWVRAEVEKYAAVVEKRHHLELEAFAEQMRSKDEKLEAYRWRLMSLEIESKRLQSYVEGLNHNMSKLRHENMKMVAMLSEREEEINSMKDKFVLQLKPSNGQKMNVNPSLHDPALTNDTAHSKVKSTRKRSMEKEREKRTIVMETSPEDLEIKEKSPPCNELKNECVIVELDSPEKDFEEEKYVVSDSSSAQKLASSSQVASKMNNSIYRSDIHALGVSYKIKRLKQQLLLLERLTGKTTKSEDDNEKKGFVLLMSLLNKQVSRYQSLQGKADDLCKRMHEISAEVSCGESNSMRRKGDSKKRGHFLEETFQLQRYIVATGQRLMEIQSKIAASGFAGVTEELDDKSITFDKDRFTDNVKTLFQDVQRGLEVRIARIIGDLEGSLACEGMVHLKRGK